MKTQTKTKSFRQRGVKLCAAFLLVILLAACGTQGENKPQTKTDEKGFYSYDGYVVKTDYPLDEDSVNKAAEKIKNIYDMYLEGTNVHAPLIGVAQFLDSRIYIFERENLSAEHRNIRG